MELNETQSRAKEVFANSGTMLFDFAVGWRIANHAHTPFAHTPLNDSVTGTATPSRGNAHCSARQSVQDTRVVPELFLWVYTKVHAGPSDSSIVFVRQK